MLDQVKQRFCKHCNRQVAAIHKQTVKQRTEMHGCFFMLTFFCTAGLALPLWIAYAYHDNKTGWRCPICGGKTK